MDNPSFFLEGVVRDKDELQNFEGPLSLILLLLSKNKIEIRDISISDILDQYLEYLDKMQSMDLEIASEFVQMAAHLLYIKTRTLLAGDEEVSELEVLMASLEQLKCRDIFASIQKVLPELKRASEIGCCTSPRCRSLSRHRARSMPTGMSRSTCSRRCIHLLRGGRSPEPDISAAVPKRIIYSVRDKSLQILHRLRDGCASLNEIYRDCRSRSEVVAAFMSILELCSMGSIHISRGENDYSLEFVGGDMDSIMTKIVE